MDDWTNKINITVFSVYLGCNIVDPDAILVLHSGKGNGASSHKKTGHWAIVSLVQAIYKLKCDPLQQNHLVTKIGAGHKYLLSFPQCIILRSAMSYLIPLEFRLFPPTNAGFWVLVHIAWFMWHAWGPSNLHEVKHTNEIGIRLS